MPDLVNIGSAPNDGTGDVLRDAFTKANEWFAFLENTNSGGEGLESFTNYAALRSYGWPTDTVSGGVVIANTLTALRSGVVVTDAATLLGRTLPVDGSEGLWIHDSDDTTSADNDITIVVNGDDRWKRLKDGAWNAKWGATVQAVIDVVFAAGGGTIFLPRGTYTENIEVKDKVHLIAEPGTIFRPATNDPLIMVSGVNTTIKNIYCNGTDPADDTTPLCTHAFEIRNGNCTLINCGAEGAVFDSLYVKMNIGSVSEGFFDYNGNWRPSARNTCSIVHGSKVRHYGSFFKEETGTYDASANSSFDGLYLYDIEPNAGQQAFDISHYDCIYERETTNVDLSFQIIESATTTPPNGVWNINLFNPTFRGAANPAIRIKNNATGVIRGLNIFGGRFSQRMFLNAGDDATRLEDSTISGVTIGHNALTFGAQLGNGVILQGVHTTHADGTISVSKFAGSSPTIIDVDGQSNSISAGSPFHITQSATPIESVYTKTIAITTQTDVVRLGIRGSYIITIAGADASDGDLGITVAEIALVNSNNRTSHGSTRFLINGSDLGIAWKDAVDGLTSDNKRTLMLTPQNTAANEWVVSVRRLSGYPESATVTWLV